jgi:hypothetical protein
MKADVIHNRQFFSFFNNMESVSLSEIRSLRKRHASLGTIFRKCREKYTFHGDVVLIRAILLHFKNNPKILGRPSNNERRAVLKLVTDCDRETARSSISDLNHIFSERIEWGR